MKKKIKLLLSGILVSTMMLAVVSAFSQPTITFNPTSPTTGLAPGANVSIEVIATSAVNIGAFAVMVNYDRDVLTFSNAILNPTLASTPGGGLYVTNGKYLYTGVPHDTVARISWGYTGSGGVACTTGLVLFTMNFTFNGGTTGSAPISFYATNISPNGTRIQSPPPSYNLSTSWNGTVPISGSYGTLTSVPGGGDWKTGTTWVGGTKLPNRAYNVVIAGAVVTDTSTTGRCHDLTINDIGNLTVDPGKSLAVGGNIAILSSSAGSGSFLNNGTFTVAGSTSAQRWVSSNWSSGFPTSSTIWHYISSPVSGATAGTFMGSLLNRWTEPVERWDTIVSPNTTLDPGFGYGLAKHVPDGNVTFAGTLNNLAAYNPGITLTGSAGANHGWNLLGNPYPCAIDWDLITAKTNVAGVVYTWNDLGKNYLSWNGTAGGLTGGIIHAEQAFFVQATASGAAITIPSSARLHSSTMFYKNSVTNLLSLKVQGNEPTYDLAFIHFRPEATNGFDNEYDAYKLFGTEDAPQLYSMTANENLTINSLPDEVSRPIIALGLKVGLSGTYTITASSLETFAPGSEFFLEDILASKIQDLSTNPVYSFTASPGDAAHRFNLHFATVGYTDNNLSNIKIYGADKTVYVNIPSDMKGNIIVYNMLGSEITRSAIQGTSLNKINVNVPSGFYIVKVEGNSSSTAGKVFLR